MGHYLQKLSGAGGAPIIHLKGSHTALYVQTDRLCVLPAYIDNGPAFREQVPGAFGNGFDLRHSLIIAVHFHQMAAVPCGNEPIRSCFLNISLADRHRIHPGLCLPEEDNPAVFQHYILDKAGSYINSTCPHTFTPFPIISRKASILVLSCGTSSML